MDLEELIKNEFLNYNNTKIKEETLEQYLKSLKNKDLLSFIAIQIFADQNINDLIQITKLESKPKKDIVEYITNNLDKILRSYIKIINPIELEQLKLIIKFNNKEIMFNDRPISIHFINLVKNLSLAKVEYNKEKDSLKFYMPEEFINIFNKALKDKKLLEKSKYNYDVFNHVKMIIDTYGIITLDKLYELFNSQIFKIDKEKLEQIISTICVIEEMPTYKYGNKTLLCSLEFTDYDKAIKFYKKQKMNYKKYTKEEYEKIYNYQYLEDLQSYKNFKSYLCENYEDIEEDFDYINNFIIYDYITFAQVSVKEAEKVFRNNAPEVFDTDEENINIMLKYLKNIFNDCPKWIKRGNV